jgi:hypothetical protein
MKAHPSWVPLVVASLSELDHPYQNALYAAIPDSEAARLAVRTRLIRWSDRKIREGSRLALREFSLSWFDTGVASRDFAQKLRGGLNRKRSDFVEWFKGCGTGEVEERLKFLAGILDPTNTW